MLHGIVFVVLSILGFSLHSGTLNMNESKENLTHAMRKDTVEAAVTQAEKKIRDRGDLPHFSREKQMEILHQLANFDLGLFLLQHGGLNGYWTHYIVNHPTTGRVTGLNNRKLPFNSVEDFFLNKAPTTLATQERYLTFKRECQKRLKEGVSLASIPCGLMGNLLQLDYSGVSNFTLTGIDLDPDTLQEAKQLAKTLKLEKHCEFLLRNAWLLNISDSFDLITSNGLSIYEPDDQKVIQLYKIFFVALKPGGSLITSFLSLPPSAGDKSEWKVGEFNPQDALLQKLIFTDILETKWQIFRSEETVRAQLKEAGFGELELIYDRAHIFPTIIAKKPL